MTSSAVFPWNSFFPVISSYSTAPKLIFFFNDTATTEISTLSLHDALPIYRRRRRGHMRERHRQTLIPLERRLPGQQDRKSTRLNSSHHCISYAVFCLERRSTRSRETRIGWYSVSRVHRLPTSSARTFF